MKTKKGFGFWGPVIVVTGGLGVLAYTLIKRDMDKKKSENIQSNVKHGFIKVTPYLSRIGTSDETNWKLNIKALQGMVTPVNIKIFSTNPTAAYDYTYTMDLNATISMASGNQYDYILKNNINGKINIDSDSYGYISVINANNGDILYFADYQMNKAVYDQIINDNYGKPIIKEH